MKLNQKHSNLIQFLLKYHMDFKIKDEIYLKHEKWSS